MRRIFLAGHRGMVGSAIERKLSTRAAAGEAIELIKRDRTQLDLTDQAAVRAFFAEARPTEVILCAARVGGIHANQNFPADFIYDNLIMQCNVIEAAFRAGIDRLLQLGSSCIYPKLANQPMSEQALLTGELESTNEPYAIAKIAGIKLCESYNRQHGTDYRSVMPTNLYGPGDNFHPENSHVLPALLQRVHLAKENGDEEVVVWGSGQPRREFLHVDDMADASLFVHDLQKDIYQRETEPMLSHVNVGYGSDVSIAELAQLVVETVGYEGQIRFDASKPDGTPQKLMDSRKLARLGWTPHIDFTEGVRSTYDWYRTHIANVRS